jgi:hypothetical protein
VVVAGILDIHLGYFIVTCTGMHSYPGLSLGLSRGFGHWKTHKDFAPETAINLRKNSEIPLIPETAASGHKSVYPGAENSLLQASYLRIQ